MILLFELMFQDHFRNYFAREMNNIEVSICLVMASIGEKE